MKIDELKSLALSYSDRETDAELPPKMDAFLRMAEARVNRLLTVQKMSIRTSLTIVPGQEYYGLPADYSGMRDIEVRVDDQSDTRIPLIFLPPEQMNLQAWKHTAYQIAYSVIANQLQILPAQDSGILEIVYYRKLIPLTDIEPSNWMSADNPDVYLAALMVEISAFVKNAEAASLWDGRLMQAIGEIIQDDENNRWPNTPMVTRLEGGMV